jgi:hypothetical protein
MPLYMPALGLTLLVVSFALIERRRRRRRRRHRRRPPAEFEDDGDLSEL